MPLSTHPSPTVTPRLHISRHATVHPSPVCDANQARPHTSRPLLCKHAASSQPCCSKGLVACQHLRGVCLQLQHTINDYSKHLSTKSLVASGSTHARSVPCMHAQVSIYTPVKPISKASTNHTRDYNCSPLPSADRPPPCMLSAML